jgi:ubiquinone/menaquinone biosynthesis C-methylase UbiE
VPSAGEPNIDPNAVYALGTSSSESARLQRQADELEPDSAALLDRVGLRPGDSAIDLGCGPRGVIELLAKRVSPGGRVVGLDGDSAHVAMASELVAERALSDVEIVSADARHTGLESGSFDLVHARTLLVTLPEPAEVLNEMVRLARPGGWVAGLEPDTETAICYPPHAAFDRLCEIFTAAFTRNGADPHIGRRMASSTARRDSTTSRCKRGPGSIRPATRAARSVPTWSARCARRSWIWDWRMSGNLKSWMPPHARISRTLTRLSCPR